MQNQSNREITFDTQLKNAQNAGVCIHQKLQNGLAQLVASSDWYGCTYQSNIMLCGIDSTEAKLAFVTSILCYYYFFKTYFAKFVQNYIKYEEDDENTPMRRTHH